MRSSTVPQAVLHQKQTKPSGGNHHIFPGRRLKRLKSPVNSLLPHPQMPVNFFSCILLSIQTLEGTGLCQKKSLQSLSQIRSE